MIPTNKSEPKHHRIKGISRAQKTDENSSKRHENPTSYKPGIDATMKASIRLEVRFFTNEGKNLTLESKEMRSSTDGWFAWKR
jgi:hypothetical protein